MKTIIDTSAKPVLPWDWYIVGSNKTYGKVDASKLRLYTPKGKTFKEVRKEVKDMSVANWAVNQWLYEHPDQVPEELKDYWCYFFGTELRDEDGDWRVPYSYWDDGSWSRGARWLTLGWNSGYRIVLLETGALDSASDLGSLDIALTTAIETVKAAGYKIFKEI